MLLVSPATALADQNDPRLGELFRSLENAGDPGEAASLEQEIWNIWHTAPNEELQGLLESGMAAMNRADFGHALDLFEQMTEIAPEYAEGWNKRATVHYILNNFKESLADIAETLKREPRHFGALSGKGLVHIRDDNFDAALLAFEEALRVSPQNRGTNAHLKALKKILGQRDI
ncbi:MAG: tetratricopeptide repeat protein [Hyphomicrobiales bacterium]